MARRKSSAAMAAHPVDKVTWLGGQIIGCQRPSVPRKPDILTLAATSGIYFIYPNLEPEWRSIPSILGECSESAARENIGSTEHVLATIP